MSATVSFKVPSPRGPQPVTVSYARVGSGEPLLLLHGIGHHRQAWDPVVDLLATERDVIAVDLPGFGASPLCRTASPTTCPRRRPCSARSARRWSWSVRMWRVIHWAVCSPWRTGRAKLARSVTALSPAGFWSEAERRYAFGVLLTMRQISRRLPLPLVRQLSRSAAGRTMLTSTIYARPHRRSPEAVVAETLALARATGFDATLTAGSTVRFTDDLPGIPVTVAWGTRDMLLVRRQGVRAKQLIPRARLVRLPGCGHCPMNDDPALVARVILDGSR